MHNTYTIETTAEVMMLKDTSLYNRINRYALRVKFSKCGTGNEEQHCYLLG